MAKAVFCTRLWFRFITVGLLLVPALPSKQLLDTTDCFMLHSSRRTKEQGCLYFLGQHSRSFRDVSLVYMEKVLLPARPSRDVL